NPTTSDRGSSKELCAIASTLDPQTDPRMVRVIALSSAGAMNLDHAVVMCDLSWYTRMLPTITGHTLGAQNHEVGSMLAICCCLASRSSAALIAGRTVDSLRCWVHG